MGSVHDLQREILGYLMAHPGAADTREGITEWWMLERCIQRQLREVDDALHQLIGKGLVETIHMASSAPCFRLRPDRIDEVRHIVEAKP